VYGYKETILLYYVRNRSRRCRCFCRCRLCSRCLLLLLFLSLSLLLFFMMLLMMKLMYKLGGRRENFPLDSFRDKDRVGAKFKIQATICFNFLFLVLVLVIVFPETFRLTPM